MGLPSRRTGAAAWRSLPSAVVSGIAVGALAAGALGALAGLADLTDGGADAAPLLLTGVAATLPGWLLYRGVSRPHRHQAGDILTGVTTAFLAMVAVGALLYLATGAHGAFDDAVFESAAGFSTTAMTLLDVEELGRGVLLFRAASQWVGGLGALLLGIAILPALSVGRELADRRRGMGRKPLAPSGGTAARNVLGLYGSFTLLMFLGYLVAGVGFIGSLVLAASTVSTGGFVGPGDPLAGAGVQWVAIGGMVVAGASLVVIWRLLTRQWGGIRRAAEFRAYLLFLVAGSLLLAWWTDAAGWSEWRQAVFTLVSAATTTGFPSDPVGAWAAVAPVFLLVGVLGWGLDGLLSSALALVLVAVNFRLGAAIITRAAQISINALYGAVLGGYVVRLALMTAVVLVVKAVGLLATVPFAITLLVTHLGLLAWESRHVAMTLAAPGLKPKK